MAANKTLMIGAAGTGLVVAGVWICQHQATSFADAAAAGDEATAERAARLLSVNDSPLFRFLLFVAVATFATLVITGTLTALSQQ